MRKFFRIFKHILITLVIVLAALYALLYTIISLPSVQEKIKTKGENILTETIGVPLSINRIEFSPFNRIELFGVIIPDQKGDTLLSANKIGVGIDLSRLIGEKQICLNNVQLFGADARINRNTPDSATNLQFIIDAFKPQEPKEKKPLDLRISSVLIRRSKVRYDVISQPHKGDSIFDSNHIAVNDITASISLKALTNDSIDVHIKRLSCKEQSGLIVERLGLRAQANRQKATISEFALRLPNSLINTDIATLDWSRMGKIAQIADSATFTLGLNNTHITLSDIAPLVPTLANFDTPIELKCRINGTLNNLNANNIMLSMGDNAIDFFTQGSVHNLLNNDSISFNCNPIRLETTNNGASLLAENLGIKSKHIQDILRNLGITTFNGRVAGNTSDITTYGQLHCGIGALEADIKMHSDTSRNILRCQGRLDSDGINLAQILGEKSRIGLVVFNLELGGELSNGSLRRAQVDGSIDRVDYNTYSFNDIIVDAEYDKKRFSGIVQLNDDNGYVNADGTLHLDKDNAYADIEVICDNLDLAALNLVPQAEGNRLSFYLDANYTGIIDNANGYIHFDDITYGNYEQQIHFDNLAIDATNENGTQHISLTSDYLNGKITGSYSFATLLHTLQNMATPLLPSLIPPSDALQQPTENDINIALTLAPYIEMSQVLKLPFTLTDTAYIDGFINESLQKAQVNLRAPNIWMGKTHLENMSASLFYLNKQLELMLQTDMKNAKDVTTTLTLDGNVTNDRVNIGVDWDSDASSNYDGQLALQSLIQRNKQDNKSIDINIDILPTDFCINDTVWNIKPAKIFIHNKDIAIQDIEISRPSQHIRIGGNVSENISDTLHVDLKDVSLDYIFETLNINYVTFGGRATGRVDAANLYSKSPHISTHNNLYIKDFSYNEASFGDLSIFSRLDVEEMGIILQGTITNKRGNESYVDGCIYPTRDSLSIAFDVDHVPLKFIHPFVAQIFDEIEGEASGKVVLEGNFARIYLYGDAYAHNFTFGIPFLNTRYHVSDSVHFDTDRIYFNNVVATDDYGNTAKADGEIKHKYFAQLDYDIQIYDTDRLLVFNLPREKSPMFYGTVYASGRAEIGGNDFRTDIGVYMTTDPNSTFTFALTNTTNAIDYQFLTFTNKRMVSQESEVETMSKADSLVMANNTKIEKSMVEQRPPALLNLMVEANITPDVDFTLVMNEMTGDKLRATGEGLLRLEYNTADLEINMHGPITINKGTYNFSIEDIITRDFKINEGSSVTFRGNPLNAQLDINATYSLQANLSDLDNSFANDTELTRSTVPVNTILHIQGDLMKPDLNFSIELPTQSADMASKLNSLISTEDMMNRQIIYLLAFNQFFTPEYNTVQNSNNDFTSMAASTLSSSLGALLGQIDENWNISPKVRSELGDFSDLEVDLFLSSQLLNDRLIFNGNFGYRDSRYSSTNFIGDFDIEYLLTKNGNLRVKGYSHFNDRNYSIRTAVTTQGLGLMFKRDFDSWRSLFGIKKKKDSPRSEETEEATEQPTTEEVITNSKTTTSEESHTDGTAPDTEVRRDSSDISIKAPLQ